MAKRGPKPKKTEFYVDPVEFKNLLITFYATGKGRDELAVCIMKIAEGLSHSGNFNGYTYKGDMVGDALVKMYAAVENKKFDVTSEYNPFSYFTTIAFHAFINRIKKEKRHHETINEYKEKFYREDLVNSGDEHGIDLYVKPTHDEDQDDFSTNGE